MLKLDSMKKELWKSVILFCFLILVATDAMCSSCIEASTDEQHCDRCQHGKVIFDHCSCELQGLYAVNNVEVNGA